ncbi:MAG: hypothetical protein R3C61_11970 [Bacteroidia bacterium]
MLLPERIRSVAQGRSYAGISPSLTIEFDTYDNGSSVKDLSDDHISYVKSGNQTKTLTSTVCIKPSCANIEDGAVHSVKIEWKPNTYTLDTYIDGDLRVSYTGDIVNTIFSGQEWVYFGMTAATGGARNLQKFYPTAFQAVGESNSFPVEWLYIDAKEENGNGVITWGTAKELNSDYFAVERSTDGQEFKELDRVAAAGVSNENLDYTFTDYQVTAPGLLPPAVAGITTGSLTTATSSNWPSMPKAQHPKSKSGPIRLLLYFISLPKEFANQAGRRQQ